MNKMRIIEILFENCYFCVPLNNKMENIKKIFCRFFEEGPGCKWGSVQLKDKIVCVCVRESCRLENRQIGYSQD